MFLSNSVDMMKNLLEVLHPRILGWRTSTSHQSKTDLGIKNIVMQNTPPIQKSSDFKILWPSHTIYTRNNMGQKREGNCGLWVLNYRISSNKTRGYYLFTRPSTAGIIRMRALIEGWYYYQDLMYSDIKTRKP